MRKRINENVNIVQKLFKRRELWKKGFLQQCSVSKESGQMKG
jgi:hypothetical protein